MNSGRAKVREENRQYLKSICQVAVLCVRQDIALIYRGHQEHDDSSHPIKEIFVKLLTLFHLKTDLYCKKVLEMQNVFQNLLKMTYYMMLLKVMTEVIIDEVKGLSSLQL